MGNISYQNSMHCSRSSVIGPFVRPLASMPYGLLCRTRGASSLGDGGSTSLPGFQLDMSKARSGEGDDSVLLTSVIVSEQPVDSEAPVAKNRIASHSSDGGRAGSGGAATDSGWPTTEVPREPGLGLLSPAILSSIRYDKPEDVKGKCVCCVS